MDCFGDRIPRVTEETYEIVQVKAFGDLVIAAAGVRKLPEPARHRVGLLVAPHLRELADALSPCGRVATIPIADDSMPALFDPRPRRAIDRLRSALSLRRALSESASGSTVVMRHLGWTHRFVTGRCKAIALPDADNLYAAYDAFLREVAGGLDEMRPASSERRPRSIAVCPSSRIDSKTLPADVVAALAETCAAADFAVEVLLLEGESFGARDVLATTVVPRRFAALADALASHAAVISADSLPAHLAEYRGTPVFVVAPHPNVYWLPARAFADGSWGVFDDPAGTRCRLERFLADLDP